MFFFWFGLLAASAQPLDNQAEIDSLEKTLKEAEDDLGRAYISNQIAKAYGTNNPIEQLNYARKGLNIAKKAGSQSEQAVSYNLIAQILRLQGDYAASLDNSLRSLTIYESLGDTVSIGQLLFNISSLYYLSENYSKSMQYSRKALSLEEKLGNYNRMAHYYIGIGINYSSLDSIDKAYEAYRQALKLINQSEKPSKFSEALVYTNLAVAYEKQHDYDSARHYYNVALKTREAYNDNEGVIYILNGLANLLIEQEKDISKAIAYSKRAEKMARKTQNLESLCAAVGNLSRAYFVKNDYKTAYDYQKEYYTLKDSLDDSKNSKEINQIESKIKWIKQEQALIKEQEVQKEVIASRDNTITRQSAFLTAVGVGFLVVILLAFFLYRLTRQQRLVNETLQLQNNQIEKQNNQLVRQQEMLKAQTSELRKANTRAEDLYGLSRHLSKKTLDDMNKELQKSSNETLRQTATLLTGALKRIFNLV